MVLGLESSELRLEREKSCELKSIESTDLYQQLIHDKVRTEVCKPLRHIRASDCYIPFSLSGFCAV